MIHICSNGNDHLGELGVHHAQHVHAAHALAQAQRIDVHNLRWWKNFCQQEHVHATVDDNIGMTITSATSNT